MPLRIEILFSSEALSLQEPHDKFVGTNLDNIVCRRLDAMDGINPMKEFIHNTQGHRGK